ncbi:MAG: tripartite tricarboxylate transporter TctB family protein [Alphaproteobacteria bacterium]|nr:tripartite tricarboxylate transporter TctB family protein [Alphaproteobacteria bacterium]
MPLGRDGIAGLIAAALGLVLFVQTFAFPQMPLVPVGPGFYPRIVLAAMVLAGAGLALQDWRARRGAGAEAEPLRLSLPGRLVLAGFAIVAAYCALLPVLGYRLATLLFVAIFQAALEWPRQARDWVWLAGVALATTVVTYLMFESYLLVLLPRGSLTGW